MSLEWWQRNIVYHIYLPSFKDGNDDGIGDFKGLISKLDYFNELKISSLLLSPFYPSPMKDNGYDISSYTDIDPRYGCMEDFDQLMEELNKRGMNIIIDFVANHTSDQHDWFKRSILREEPYTEFYIWADPLPGSAIDNPLPPNNWNVLRFWLNKGVDGFRIDAASHLIEDERLIDEPLNKKLNAKEGEYKYLNHIYTKGNEENLDLIEEWKHVLNEFSTSSHKPKILLVEAMEKIEDVMYYYGTFERKLAEIPMNFQFYKIKPESTGEDLQKFIEDWLTKMPKGKYPNWVMSSHDDARVVTRVGSTLASSLHMVMMLLPGLPIWYYGDELGMENGIIQPEDMRDSYALRTVSTNSRDPMRTPMQWNCEKNAGFSTSDTPWLPVNTSCIFKNVEVERKDPFSFLNNFKKLITIREEPAILFSSLVYPVVNEKLFSVLRSVVGAKCFLLLLNMSSEPLRADMTTLSSNLPQKAILELTNCEKYYTQKPQLQKHLGDNNNSSLLETTSSSCNSESACASTGASCVTESAEYIDPVPSTSFASEISTDVNFQEFIYVPLNDIYLGPHQAIVLSYIG
ncbi:maltase 1 isoform X2 [Parasteatoda tepidariorum]|uniref:maltase 1 isoform X2 n=1 Tax=Parasteatoda tepidariorum TaxID=114398 RepID=UPI0039BD213A